MKNSAAGPWLSQIEGARSTRDLVAVLRDFLGSMTPEQLQELPAACRAESISTAAEIQEWAVTLAREDLKSAVYDMGTLHLAAAVFAAAGGKLPKLDNRASE
jgi:hypothetical protein